MTASIFFCFSLFYSSISCINTSSYFNNSSFLALFLKHNKTRKVNVPSSYFGRVNVGQSVEGSRDSFYSRKISAQHRDENFTGIETVLMENCFLLERLRVFPPTSTWQHRPTFNESAQLALNNLCISE